MEEDWETAQEAFGSPSAWREYLGSNSFTLGQLSPELKRKSRYLSNVREWTDEDMDFVSSFVKVVRKTRILSLDTEGKLDEQGRVSCSFAAAPWHKWRCVPYAHLLLGNAAFGSLLIRLDHENAIPEEVLSLFDGSILFLGVAVSGDIQLLRQLGYPIPLDAWCVEIEPFAEALYYREGFASLAFDPWWAPIGYRPELGRNLGFFAFMVSGRSHKPPKIKSSKKGPTQTPLAWYSQRFGVPPEPIPEKQTVRHLYVWHGPMKKHQELYTVIDATTPIAVLAFFLEPAAGKHSLDSALRTLLHAGIDGWEARLAAARNAKEESIASRVVARRGRKRKFTDEKRKARNRDRKRRRKLAKYFKKIGADKANGSMGPT